MVLHKTGSTNEVKLRISVNYNVKFYPFFIVKDLFTVCLYLILFFFFIFFKPELLNHSINYIASNPLVTPVHIVPE
jgi:ubiquinol-cytochrome c reductase cytochrome b subunit